jgi:deoxyribonuclease-1-like protein
MRFFFTFCCTICMLSLAAQNSFKLCSWNITNFGKSKPKPTMDYIASIIKEHDVATIIDVAAGEGTDAAESLKESLNADGDEWNYVLSPKTSSATNRSTRYLVFWKKASLEQYGQVHLENIYGKQIDHEPFLVDFRLPSGKTFTLAPFHAVPISRKPEKEAAYLQYIPAKYPQKNIIFCGTFNLSGEHPSFGPLKSKGYDVAFFNQKTTLQASCFTEDCLASAYDNVFFRTDKLEIHCSAVSRFYKNFSNYSEALEISGHIPVFIEFNIN